MPRGRKPNTIPSVEWKCHIPIDLATQVDLLLLDPTTGKPVHGARSTLVAGLIRQWLARQRQNQGSVPLPGGKPEPALDNLAAHPYHPPFDVPPSKGA